MGRFIAGVAVGVVAVLGVSVAWVVTHPELRTELGSEESRLRRRPDADKWSTGVSTS